MNVFSKPFEDITFEDVEKFCEKQLPESTTLDYKQAVPRDLAKHYAAFSNTLGGVIIIGVEEDPKTGLPLKWTGVTNDGKLLERINQFAANTTPLPSYHARVTNEKNGKVFALVNILEGDAPPYYANGDQTVWLRTGNISKPLQQPDREELQRMVEKQKIAGATRKSNIEEADKIFTAGLERAERDRQKAIADSVQSGKPHGVATEPLNKDTSFLIISLQPYYPKRMIVEPRDIKAKLNDLQTANKYGMSFPPLDMEPIPKGLFAIKQSWAGDQVRGYQLYGNGLIHYTEDVWLINKTYKKVIYLSHIGYALYRHLVFARKFYDKFNYSGIVIGKVSLENAMDANLQIIIPENYYSLFPEQYNIEKINDYEWELETDTHTLSDPELLNGLFKKVLKDIYWSLGIATFQDDVIDKWIEEANWK